MKQTVVVAVGLWEVLVASVSDFVVQPFAGLDPFSEVVGFGVVIEHCDVDHEIVVVELCVEFRHQSTLKMIMPLPPEPPLDPLPPAPPPP